MATVSFVEVAPDLIVRDPPVYPIHRQNAFHVFVHGDDTEMLKMLGPDIWCDYRPVWTAFMSIHRANRVIYRLLKHPVEHVHVPWAQRFNQIALAPFGFGAPTPAPELNEPWWYHVTAGDVIQEMADASLKQAVRQAQPTIWDLLLED